MQMYFGLCFSVNTFLSICLWVLYACMCVCVTEREKPRKTKKETWLSTALGIFYKTFSIYCPFEIIMRLNLYVVTKFSLGQSNL